MNIKGHLKWYFITMIPLTCFIIGYHLSKFFGFIWFNPELMLLKWWYIFAFYIVFFIVNPDIDLLFGISEHRSFITHSALFPIGIYWAFHDFINMETAKIFGLIIFTPVFIHLLCDYKIGNIIDNEDGKGSWCISWNFLSIKIKLKKRKSTRIGFANKRMNKRWSIIWVSGNLLFIIIYVLWIWNII